MSLPRDKDRFTASWRCSSKSGGAGWWWYRWSGSLCYQANLNGQNSANWHPTKKAGFIEWFSIKGVSEDYAYNWATTQMSIFQTSKKEARGNMEQDRKKVETANTTMLNSTAAEPSNFESNAREAQIPETTNGN